MEFTKATALQALLCVQDVGHLQQQHTFCAGMQLHVCARLNLLPQYRYRNTVLQGFEGLLLQ